MGWNQVALHTNSELTNGFDENFKFYFVHSYYVKCHNEDESILQTNYEGFLFDSALQKENIYGAQFHPEKSHKFGMRLLQNFCEL